MEYPLIALSLVFSLGILSAAYFKIPFFVFYFCAGLFLVAGIIFIGKGKKFEITILSAVFFLGAAVLSNCSVRPGSHLYRLVPYRDDSVYVSGVIDSFPLCRERRVSFILRAETSGISGVWRKTCGRVLVEILSAGDRFSSDPEKNGFSYGDRLLLKGRLARPVSFSKRFSYRDYLEHRGIYNIFRVRSGIGVVKKLGRNAANPLIFAAFRLRRKVKSIIVNNLSVFSSTILNAVILGERQNLPLRFRDLLVYSGTAHIIAISGMHVGIVSFIILLILKVVRIPRRPRYILTAFVIIGYCFLSGANTPVMRAAVAALLLLFGYFPKREVNILNSLSLAALIILAFNPRQLFEVSFQLSFLSVISLVWLSPQIKGVFPEEINRISCLRFFISAFSLSFAAWSGILPVIAYYFKIISPVAILANMIIVPYMAVIVASGFSLVLAGIFIPSLAHVFAAGSEFFILVLARSISFFTLIPGAYFKLPDIPFSYVVLYYAFLIAAVYLFRRSD